MVVAIISVLTVVIDQLTKWWAYKVLRTGGDIELIKNALYFSYTTNEGMAFGMLKDHRWIFLTLTTVIIAAIIAFLIFTRKQKKHFCLNTALALIVGGGAGNMIDRIFYGDTLFCGKVIDFIDVRIINFAIFNMADVAVCIGEALLVLYVLFIDSKIALANDSMFSFSKEN